QAFKTSNRLSYKISNTTSFSSLSPLLPPPVSTKTNHPFRTASWHPTETETDTTFLTVIISHTPDPTSTTTETATSPSPTYPSTHIVTATTTVPWDASKASAAAKKSAAAAVGGASGGRGGAAGGPSAAVAGGGVYTSQPPAQAAAPPPSYPAAPYGQPAAAGNAPISIIIVAPGGGPAPAPAAYPPAQPPSQPAPTSSPEFDPNPSTSMQGLRKEIVSDCTTNLRVCITEHRVPTRTVYVAFGGTVLSQVDCGGCRVLKVHRQVCDERPDLVIPTVTIAGATRTSTQIVCIPTPGIDDVPVEEVDGENSTKGADGS
ncbi:MAG: hypothetical protein Q9192_008549, partial [Flavoplaca navasiana]